MTLNEVIKLGKEADISIDVNILNHPTWVWIIVASGVALFILAMISESIGSKGFAEFAASLGSLVMVIGVPCLLFTTDIEVENGIGKWKEEIATPYIESLPLEEKEIVFIKIDPELTSDTKGGLSYTYSTDVEKTPITVSFKDDGKVITKTSWVETDMELSDSDKPYVEFQRLEKDLGHGLDAGIYNMKIHLPENYTFTEIK